MDNEKTIVEWKPLSEYNGGRVLATNDLDLLIGEINSDGDCISDDDSTVLCGITGFADIDDVISKPKKMTLLEEVKNYLENASPEQLQQDWKEMEQFDNCGPLVKDFLYGTEKRNCSMKANEIINKLQEIIDKAKKQGHILVRIEDIEDAFPELKESEDERIRKALIDYFRHHKIGINIFYGIKGDDIIAWLEKRGEQKPADEDKPKFKVGDWITNGRYIEHIIGINQDWPYYMFEYGTTKRIKDIDKKYRLWTIQDAKDGDVLADGNLPFIFKKTDSMMRSYAYCGISVDSGFKFESEGELGEWTWMPDIKPATKEQRDLLFQKMKEAGYGWDSEKKELKKLAHQEVTKTSDKEGFIEIPFGADNC